MVQLRHMSTPTGTPETATFDASTGKALPRVIDWPRIRAQFATSAFTSRQLAAEHGISHTAINKRARNEQWQRDLTVRVKLAADAKVARAAAETVAQVAKNARRAAKAGANVSTPPTPETVYEPDEARAMVRSMRASMPHDLQTEAEVIDSEASIQAAVRISHRRDIARVRALGSLLMCELELATANSDVLEEFGHTMRESGEDGRDRKHELYEKFITLPARVETAKKLVETMRIAIGLEREALGMQDATNTDLNPLAALLKNMRRSALPVVHQVEPDMGI